MGAAATVSTTALRRWDAETVNGCVAALRADASTARQVSRSVDRMLASLNTIWTGAAAESAAAVVDVVRLALAAVAGSQEAMAAVLAQFAAQIAPAQDLLRAADHEAAVAGVLIADNGRSVLPRPGHAPTAAELSRPAIHAPGWASTALGRASDADIRAAAGLRQVGVDAYGRAGGQALMPSVLHALQRLASGVVRGTLDTPVLAALAWLTLPSDEAELDPAEVAQWWAALGPALQNAAVTADPARVGRLDGLPAKERDGANRAVLDRDIASLSRRLDKLQSPIVPDGTPLLLREQARLARAAGVADTQRRLQVLTTVHRTLDQGPDRLLLLLDSRTPARVVVSLGDPDTATHVAVLVPGMDTTVAGDLGRVVGTAGRIRIAAENVLGTAGVSPPPSGESVATIAWLGYVAPSLTQVVGSPYATRGAADLRRSLDSLTLTHTPGKALHLTVIGHSYGSVVAGRAVAREHPHEPSDVDDLVLAGSPGVGTAADELAVPRGHVYVLEAAGDPVADAAYFGTDPSSAGFGAVLLQTDGGTAAGAALTAAHGHSQYFDTGTESLANVAAVVVGRPDLVSVVQR